MATDSFQPVRWTENVDVLAPPKAVVGTWVNNLDTACIGSGRLNNSSAAQNDRIDFDVSLAPGTWNLTLMVVTISSGGIATVQLDDGAGSFTSAGTLDTYSAGTTYNVPLTLSGIAVALPNVHRVLRLLLATKNGASSGYNLHLLGAYWRRTA